MNSTRRWSLMAARLLMCLSLLLSCHALQQRSLLDTVQASVGANRIMDGPMTDTGAFLSIRQLVPDTFSTAWNRLWLPNRDSAGLQSAVSFAQYDYNITSKTILLSKTFSGVQCMVYAFTSSCTEPSNVVGYIADANLFLQNYYSDRYGNLSDAVPSRLLSSICINSTDACEHANVATSPGHSYNLVLANDGPGSCLVTSNYTTFDAGAPECAGLGAPELTPVGNSSLRLPLGDYPGMTSVDYTARDASLPPYDHRAVMSFLNATCLLFGLWLPSTPPSMLSQYSLRLLTQADYQAAILTHAPEPSLGDVADGWTSPEIIDSHTLASCTGDQCNVGENAWLTQTSLSSDTSYVLLQYPASYLPGGAAYQDIYVAFQAFSDDQCQMKQINAVQATSIGG